jgi:DNA-binding MarR family transcriptional regulator
MTGAAASGRAGAAALPTRRDGRLDLENYAFYLISHADLRYGQAMQAALARHDLSRPKWRALGGLGHRNGQSIGELAALTLLKRSTLSRIVERLEREGLVTRRARARDRRNAEVHITAAGRKALARILEVTGRQYARATAGLSPGELDALCRMLRRLLDNLGASA